MGWQLFRAETDVNWCGHGQEIIPFPLPDGRVTFVPVLGEAMCERGDGWWRPNILDGYCEPNSQILDRGPSIRSG